jgi:hypothetical protein
LSRYIWLSKESQEAEPLSPFSPGFSAIYELPLRAKLDFMHPTVLNGLKKGFCKGSSAY